MKTENGFTVIEILVAMAILSFGLLSLASMQITAVRVNSAASQLTQGTTLVQDKMEELMARAYNHADLADDTSVGAYKVHTEPSPPPGYTLKWEVDTNTANTFKTVIVTATWHNDKAPKSFVSSYQHNN